MTSDELFDLLDICGPEEFDCFEHMADLLECQDHIEYEDFCQILSAISLADLSEILDNYFEDILQGVSDDDAEFYTLLSTAGQAICGLAKGTDDQQKRQALIDQLYRFREWYIEPEQVVCENNLDGSRQALSVFDALTLFRTEKLLGETWFYDYENAMDYAVEEYVMSYALDETEAEDEPNSLNDEDTEESCDCGHAHGHEHHHHHDCDCDDCEEEYDAQDTDDESNRFEHNFDPYRDGLIDREHPVIDGEDMAQEQKD